METVKHGRQYPGCRLAIVVVQCEETDEEAWRRHLSLHPEDRNADIRIFHRHHPAEKPALRAGQRLSGKLSP